MTTPRPCPFCGHRPVVETVTREGTRQTATMIRCVNGYCEVKPLLGPFWNSKENTIAIWNERRRTPKQP